MRLSVIISCVLLACSSKPAAVADASACQEKGKSISQSSLPCEEKIAQLKLFTEREPTCRGLFGDAGPQLHCKDGGQ